MDCKEIRIHRWANATSRQNRPKGRHEIGSPCGALAGRNIYGFGSVVVRCFSPHPRLWKESETNLRAKAPRYLRAQSNKIHVTAYEAAHPACSAGKQTHDPMDEALTIDREQGEKHHVEGKGEIARQDEPAVAFQEPARH